MAQSNYLFGGNRIFDVVEARKHSVKKSVENLKPNDLLNASEHDLIASLVDNFRLDVPILREDEIYVADHGDVKVDVSGDPLRAIDDPSRPFYVTGTKTVIAVPFEGDRNFFYIQPQTFSMSPPRADVGENELRLVYVRADQDGEAVKREYRGAVDQIRNHLGSLKSSATAFNSQLVSLVTTTVSERKAKLLRDASMVSALGLPIKRREGAATTYAIPMSRKSTRIERPVVKDGAFQPEPALPTEEYEFILSILKNMVRVMEQSPHAFAAMHEEDLRTHFLVQLNAQYEGQATGETFNFQGKTDILIRAEGRNVFIAECGFWNGEKQFSEKIDQLLSYLSWRDTKTALLVFNRNVNFSDVLTKILAAVPKHPCFKRDLANTDESTFHYVFHQPNDANRELTLTIMAFDVPEQTTNRR